jgi:hypothetical protein
MNWLHAWASSDLPDTHEELTGQGQLNHRDLWSGRWESNPRPKLGKVSTNQVLWCRNWKAILEWANWFHGATDRAAHKPPRIGNRPEMWRFWIKNVGKRKSYVFGQVSAIPNPKHSEIGDSLVHRDFPKRGFSLVSPNSHWREALFIGHYRLNGTIGKQQRFNLYRIATDWDSRAGN